MKHIAKNVLSVWKYEYCERTTSINKIDYQLVGENKIKILVNEKYISIFLFDIDNYHE